MAHDKRVNGITKRRCRLFLRRDRRGVAAVEAAFVLPAFLALLFLIIQLGVYFTLQSVLDIAVLVTGETLRTNLATGSCPSATSALKTTIVTNGGGVISASKLSVDVRPLSTLSAGLVAIVDGTVGCGTASSGNGSVLVLRAQMTMTLVPYLTVLTMTSMSIVHNPPS